MASDRTLRRRAQRARKRAFKAAEAAPAPAPADELRLSMTAGELCARLYSDKIESVLVEMVRCAVFERHLDDSDRDYNHQWKTREDYAREEQEEATSLTRNITDTMWNMFIEEYEKEAAKAPPPMRPGLTSQMTSDGHLQLVTQYEYVPEAAPAAPPPAGPKKLFTPEEVDVMVEEMFASNQHDLWEEAMRTMEIKTMTQLERQFPGIDWGRQSNMDMLDDHGEQAGNAYEAFRTYTRKALGRLTV